MNELRDVYRTSDVVGLLRAWKSAGWTRDAEVLPILADALEEAGYEDGRVLGAMREKRYVDFEGVFKSFLKGIPCGIQDEEWANVFAYAGPKEADLRGDGTPTLRRAVPGDTGTSLAEFTRADVAEVYASDEGENDGNNWVCYGRLKDGRYFFLTAGCDYTGWG